MSSYHDLFHPLEKILGNEHVSCRQEDLFVYSRDLGAGSPGRADAVVLPGNAKEVQKVLALANDRGVPVVPWGGGLNLSGLTIPRRGGIVLDMRRMNRIVEVNEAGSYALIEAGVTIGQLSSHLLEKKTDLRCSFPDAPPGATMVANALFYGSGPLCRYGSHSEMINGLEAVLPGGQVLKTGSCALSSSWFGRSCLPDLTGLFINWFGTTGVVTRMAIRLFPRHAIRSLEIFQVLDTGNLDKIMKTVAATEMAEDILVITMAPAGTVMIFLLVYIVADSQEEENFKKSIIGQLFSCQSKDRRNVTHLSHDLFPPGLLKEFINEPKPGYAVAQTADLKKGGGFEYTGANIPMESLPRAFELGTKISAQYGFSPSFTIRAMGIAHNVIFTFVYPFNRSDPASVAQSRMALSETTKMVIDIGGIPWKPDAKEQGKIMDRMDPEAVLLMKQIRSVIDPKGIMNPGNWE
nr:FAD-binding oxidoreductase [uncultured Desulfobacter sp.]